VESIGSQFKLPKSSGPYRKAACLAKAFFFTEDQTMQTTDDADTNTIKNNKKAPSPTASRTNGKASTTNTTDRPLRKSPRLKAIHSQRLEMPSGLALTNKPHRCPLPANSNSNTSPGRQLPYSLSSRPPRKKRRIRYSNLPRAPIHLKACIKSDSVSRETLEKTPHFWSTHPDKVPTGFKKMKPKPRVTCIKDCFKPIPDNRQGSDVLVTAPSITSGSNKSIFVCMQVSRQQALENYRSWRHYSEAIKSACDVKPDVGRGIKRLGVTTHQQGYQCFGWRKDPLSSNISEYSFKPKIDAANKKKIKEIMKPCLIHMERLARRMLLKYAKSDLQSLDGLCQFYCIPTTFDDSEGLSTQLSVSQNYWPPSHIDDDAFYSTLSVCPKTYCRKRFKDEVLYYFVFPQYKLYVPMRAGDILIFNPLVYHCASNHLVEGAYIFASYITSKTVKSIITNHK